MKRSQEFSALLLFRASKVRNKQTNSEDESGQHECKPSDYTRLMSERERNGVKKAFQSATGHSTVTPSRFYNYVSYITLYKSLFDI
ncbi:hypothetical protein J6590_071678 [Homalodisca vitripennis]|nr:hypothetical protein J6590_071678 [Homalodisca vitripennis]